MCTKAIDKAEYRVKVAQVVAKLLLALQPKMFNKVGKWLQRFVNNSKVSYRMFALELMGYLLTNDALPNHDTPSKEFSKEVLLCSLLRRCSDKATFVRFHVKLLVEGFQLLIYLWLILQVRAKALTILALCSSSENNSLKLAMKAVFLGAPLRQEVSAVNTDNAVQPNEINLTGNVCALLPFPCG